MKYPSAWQIDGGLREIYVLGTNLRDWNETLRFLRNAYPITYRVDDLDETLPKDVRTMFESRNEHDYFMAVDAEGLNIHCHFFLVKQIEFDIDPREIDSEGKEEAVIEFMRVLADTLGKQVMLTIGSKDLVCLRLNPGQKEPDYNPIEFKQGEPMSREEALRMLARTWGMDENDPEAVIQKMLDAANKPYEG
jgi:hypothetical protein